MSALTNRMALAGVALSVVAFAPVAAQASDQPVAGVWWRFNTESGGLPTPPVLVDVPEGGLWLNSTPTGDQVTSAVRYSVSSSDLPERLTLRVHSNNSAPALVFVGCPPAKPWVPPDERPGAWESRPIPDCSKGAVEAEVGQDGKTATFDLATFDAGEDVDLVFTREPGDAQSYLDVTFEKPTAADLQMGSPVSAGGSGSFAPGSGGSTGGSPVSGGNTGGSSVDFPSGGGTTDIGASPTPLPDTVTGAGDVNSGDGGLDERGSQQVADAPVVAVEDFWDGTRVAAFVALAGLMFWMAAIVSRRLSGGAAAAGPTFTLYTGIPQADRG